ncbi:MULTISPECIES: peptidoglycan-associated lipoprotein Pal [unclassified Polaromonas]|jgi:peptidoglycan-associated lipoprotein|uniref:peptidoglycan-associated lipoprotein Pal n=1 Tax=unclassified Polaromonas TaxID=2638319 RepID=UPI000F09248E|nr:MULTISPECIES: peptidoglycan-associated lipoprotein Pal [unclassified Polaromonas]AYQ29604.1 peptidoglycan-associated lipoprotein Pal [Polaromonas sp. SP1]QGJ19282.1 peptidoglycan-associated lipoprotein Pal [Polaromonas sp. Pch-P]
MKRTIFSVISSLILAATLTACGSGVKLNDVPVEDRTGQTQQGGNASGATGSGVTPVEVQGTDASLAGPANTTKVIYFDFDSYVVKPEFQGAIESHAKYLTANKTRKMAIEGHTDERGGREYNLALGQKRAEAVRRALGLLGVSDAQVEAVSFGKEKPAVAGSDEEAMAKNRRAELNYR